MCNLSARTNIDGAGKKGATQNGRLNKVEEIVNILLLVCGQLVGVRHTT